VVAWWCGGVSDDDALVAALLWLTVVEHSVIVPVLVHIDKLVLCSSRAEVREELSLMLHVC
jgi:hypothetical protein